MLACEAQAPIVPISIEGSEATMSPPHPGFHLCKMRVVVGEPIMPPRGDDFSVADYQALADRWREAVSRLGEDGSSS
jgi:1-acyl-sn-glycerol-3-phosphate acyltransferase